MSDSVTDKATAGGADKYQLWKCDSLVSNISLPL